MEHSGKMTLPPDDLEQKVNSVMEKIQLTKENQQLKSKVGQLEKQLRPFLKPEEEEVIIVPRTLVKIFAGVLITGVLGSIGYCFYSLASPTDSRSARSPYEQTVKLHDETIGKPADYLYEPPEKYDKTMEGLEEAIRLNPKDADAYWRRGKLYTSYGTYGKAIEDFSKAIELNPKNGDYLYSRATARCYLGDKDAATFDINTLAVLGSKATPPQPDTTVQLGKCFFLQREHGLAEEFGYKAEERQE